MELQYFFKEEQIKTFIDENKNPWFIGKEIATILGYKNTKQAIIKHVDEEDRETLENLLEHVFFVRFLFGQKQDPVYSYNNLKSVYVSRNGFSSLLKKSRIMVCPRLISNLVLEYGLNLNIKTFSKEQKYIVNISKAFAFLKGESQFRIGKYRIDLYFPTIKLAVECDEFGHADRNKEKEKLRQKWIEETLGCHFIRFNPDEKGFCIFEVISRIGAVILEFSHESSLIIH